MKALSYDEFKQLKSGQIIITEPSVHAKSFRAFKIKSIKEHDWTSHLGVAGKIFKIEVNEVVTFNEETLSFFVSNLNGKERFKKANQIFLLEKENLKELLEKIDYLGNLFVDLKLGEAFSKQLKRIEQI